MPKKEAFGALLRKEREQSKKSMGALARHLNLSTPYLCDIELGRRQPLSPAHIIEAAAFLGVDSHALLRAAVEARGATELVAPKTSAGRDAVASLQRRADDLTDEQWGKIQDLINGVDK